MTSIPNDYVDKSKMYFRLVAATEYLIQSFILSERKVKTTRTPREHFVMEQCCRTAYELFCRMTRNRLGFDDVREDFENLAFLFDYLVKDTPKAAAVRRENCVHWKFLFSQGIPTTCQPSPDRSYHRSRSLDYERREIQWR